ncbi:hypothetical protein ABT299_11995 [Spirillospora sp. NPDC000708]
MPIYTQQITDIGTHGPPPELTTVTWESPLGQVTILSDWPSGYLVQPGARGLDMPTFKAYEDESPGIHGNRRRDTKANAREIMIPIAIYADDGRPAFLERKRRLLRDLSPLDGDGRGTLTLTEADGSSRSITAIYASGAEGAEDADSAGRRWITYGLTFMCESPFWLGPEFTRTFRGVGDDTPFFPSGVPWVVSDSQVLGTGVKITNPGDVPAFPVWTISGPISAATFTHPAGGSWTLTRNLSAADVAVIDCRERIETAILNGTENLWPNIDEAAVLWPLLRGTNTVDLVVAGSTSATTVKVRLQPRYLSA